MSLFDPTTGDYSEGAFGLDSHAALADQPSIFESLGNIATKAVPLIGLSIVNSFANTGIQVANMFGADVEQLSVDKEMQSLGLDSYASYYKAHEQGIEAAGLAIGSFLPGMMAIKALKLAQAGKMSGIMQRATSIFSAPRAAVIENAIGEITESGSIYNTLAADKFKAIALGFGDQALQALAYETATIATMKASPLLNEDSYGDLLSHLAFGTLTGGVIGGSIEGLIARKTINKAIDQADLLTKAAQITTRFGWLDGATSNGTNIAGDRVVAILDSLDKIDAAVPESSRAFGKQAAATRVRAMQDAKIMLQQLAPAEDVEPANALFDVLMKMKTEAGMGNEEIYERLGRLAKIGRLGDEPSIPTSDFFYVNNFTQGSRRDSSALLTIAPTPEADLTLRYQLRSGYTMKDIRVAQWDDQLTTPDGLFSFRQYNQEKEAFQDGVDIWISKGGRIRVNQNSPAIEGRAPNPGESRILTQKEQELWQKTGQLPKDSAPLFGAPLIMRVEDGAVMSSASPVVGDIAKPRLFDKGLAVGKETYLFDPADTVDMATMQPLEANARYTWAKLRGIKAGDEISATDIPMLEQLYREAVASKKGFEKFLAELEAKGVTIVEHEGLPTTPSDLLSIIRDAKDDVIHTLLENPKVSAEEVSRVANVPEKYLESGMNAAKAEDYMIDPQKYMSVNHVQLEYNIGNMSISEGNIARGLQDVQMRIQLIKDAAESAVVKHLGPKNTAALKFDLNSRAANAQGAGPGFFSFSNAAYGTLGQQAERIGQRITAVINDKMKAVSDNLLGVASKLRADPDVAAEVGNFIAARRRTGEAYTFLPKEVAARYWLDENTAVLTKSLVKNKAGAIVDWNKAYTPEGFLPGAAKVDPGVRVPDAGLHTFYHLSPSAAAWERANTALNDARLMQLNDRYAAQGVSKTLETGNLYAPPIDTGKYPYFALVKANPGTMMADDGVAMITARSAEDLKHKISMFDETQYSVYTKEMIKKDHMIQGDYDYQRNFMQARVNSEMQRRGILNDIFPDINPESVISDYLSFHSRQETRSIRDFVELNNAQLFAELRAMGSKFTEADRSRTGWLPSIFNRTPQNPYNSYIRTALGIHDRDTYRLWTEAQEKLEAFGDTAFNMVRSAFYSAKAGVISYEKAAATAERFGLGNPYGTALNALRAYGDFSNRLPEPRVLSNFISRANSVLAATTIRLDVFQSLINTISAPILTLAEMQSVKAGPLKDLVTTALPDGSTKTVPATTKLFYNSIKNWFSSETKAQWMPLYKEIGAVRDISSDMANMIDAVALPMGRMSESVALKKMNDMVEWGAKVSGSRYSEEFVRFVAADSARQIFQAAGYEGKQLADNIMTFVNRVHGNYVASQRPIAFQGPIGSAVGMFQTYQFNLMQQLFRYVENGEGKTIAMLSGLQTSIFGLQGLPGFQLINNSIIGNAANNPTHADLYSAIPNLMDRKLGDYLLYGVASNVLGTGLYTRGDINPRQITVLPLNPLQYPAIQGGITFMSNFIDTLDNIGKGGNLTTSVLLGLEHNGLSRPLAGLGQMMNGMVTTKDGSLITTTRPGQGNEMGWNDIINASNAARLLGARPLDEAITMDALYRSTVYQAKNLTRIKDLGQAAKTWLYDGGSMPNDAVENFASRYASAGGDITHFAQAMMRWTNDANVSTANKVFQQLQKPISQNMMTIMGGQPLPDYRNQGSTAVAPVQ